MWKTVKLGDVCELAYGKALDKKDRLEAGGYPAFGANGIKTQSKEPLFDKPSIIIGRKGSAGEINKVAEPFWALDVTYYTKIDEAVINVDYLFYVLTTLNLPSLARGVKPGINRNDVYGQIISLPPLAEQQRIVAKLDAAFAEIDRAVELVEAKQVYAERLKASLLDSSLKGVDATWKTVTLGDVCEVQPKKAQVKKKLSDTEEVSFIPMEDLGINKMYPTTDQTKALAKAYGSYTYFENGDVLLAKITPCFENGKVGIATNLTNGVGFGSSEYIVLRCSEQILPQYIYYHLNQPSFRAKGKAQMSGAVGHKRVPKDFIENLEIPLPPLAEQQRIVAKLDAAFADIDTFYSATIAIEESYRSLKSAILAQELQPPKSEAA